MKWKILVSISLTGLFFSGCASNIMMVEYKKQLKERKNLKEFHLANLCQFAYYIKDEPTSKSIIEEIKKRISKEEVEIIKERKIYIGMKEDLVYCLYGIPQKENQSVGVWGVNNQMVYQFSNGNRIYIYTKNGKVSSWQN